MQQPDTTSSRRAAAVTYISPTRVTSAAAAPATANRKGDYFEAHVNPKPAPLLPPNFTKQLIAPAATAVITAFILLSIKPPFIQTRNQKDQPTGNIKWLTVLFWSLIGGVTVYIGPRLVQYFSREG